ncbi:MAG TPA: cysteine-rich CWC family protein [Burkholderiales bacterium]|nr:cysteine-rich CWC family protein [Burkholderiales bacterium]
MNPALPAQKRCPDCGTAFECGMGSDQPCWCSTGHALVMPVPGAGADCYCAKCLERRIAQAGRKSASGG